MNETEAGKVLHGADVRPRVCGWSAHSRRYRIAAHGRTPECAVRELRRLEALIDEFSARWAADRE